MTENGIFGDKTECLNVGIDTLKEIKQYRAIGTVDRFEQLSEQFAPHTIDNTSCPARHCNRCDKFRKENEMYHQIGTVEECREAVGKQKPKSPDIWGDGCSEGKLVYDMYECPNCGKSYEIEGEQYEHCPKCGQAIDLSIFEEMAESEEKVHL